MVAGNTLAYRKSFWLQRFKDLQVGEDSQFVWNNVTKQIADLNDPSLCVGMVHREEYEPQTHGWPFWNACPVEHIRSWSG